MVEDILIPVEDLDFDFEILVSEHENPQILEILKQYFQGDLNITEIIAKFKLATKPNYVARILPPIYVGSCGNCSGKLVATHYVRRNYSDAKCESCMHDAMAASRGSFDYCECKECREKSRKIKEESKILTEKAWRFYRKSVAGGQLLVRVFDKDEGYEYEAYVLKDENGKDRFYLVTNLLYLDWQDDEEEKFTFKEIDSAELIELAEMEAALSQDDPDEPRFSSNNTFNPSILLAKKLMKTSKLAAMKEKYHPQNR